MSDAVEILKSFPKERDFFIGVDSDGCAFDTMEVKHKACFFPMVVQYWDLAGTARYVRDVWDFVNLYGQTRGCNRFLALLSTLDHLAGWDEVVARGYRAPDVAPLRAWVQRESKLGNPALEQAVEASGDAVLTRTLDWSRAINEQVTAIVHDVPPFPRVGETLARMAAQADVMVVSATPDEALQREWAEHEIARHVKMICGQELGKKSEHLEHAAAGRYQPEKMLMIGDAPGDLKAARHVGACFYPVNPGGEVASWQRLADEALDRFFDGSYRGEYEQSLIDEFMAHLPADPPWNRGCSGGCCCG